MLNFGINESGEEVVADSFLRGVVVFQFRGDCRHEVNVCSKARHFSHYVRPAKMLPNQFYKRNVDIVFVGRSFREIV
ncbi:hypothetical protein D3C80_1183430 [compost metagenome]